MSCILKTYRRLIRKIISISPHGLFTPALLFLFYISFNTDNQVDGKMFIKLTRSDLMDLFPSDFSARKKFWDFLSELVSF